MRAHSVTCDFNTQKKVHCKPKKPVISVKSENTVIEEINEFIKTALCGKNQIWFDKAMVQTQIVDKMNKIHQNWLCPIVSDSESVYSEDRYKLMTNLKKTWLKIECTHHNCNFSLRFLKKGNGFKFDFVGHRIQNHCNKH